MKLISISKSSNPTKKLMAIFDNDGRRKTTHFGLVGMDDYLKTHDTEQRERYRTRHHKDLNTNDPTRAGFLSYYILWGPHTSLKDNITAYKSKFNL